MSSCVVSPCLNLSCFSVVESDSRVEKQKLKTVCRSGLISVKRGAKIKFVLFSVRFAFQTNKSKGKIKSLGEFQFLLVYEAGTVVLKSWLL